MGFGWNKLLSLPESQLAQNNKLNLRFRRHLQARPQGAPRLHQHPRRQVRQKKHEIRIYVGTNSLPLSGGEKEGEGCHAGHIPNQ